MSRYVHVEYKRRSGSHAAPAGRFLPWDMCLCFLVLAFCGHLVEHYAKNGGLLGSLSFNVQLCLQIQQLACIKKCFRALKSNHIQ